MILAALVAIAFFCTPTHGDNAPPAEYSTVYDRTFAGNDADEVAAIAVDGQGYIYVAGSTASTNFAGIASLPSGANDNRDVFVMKLDPRGALVYVKTVGGHGFEYARGIAVDDQGHAYVVGFTDSTNFPTVNPYQSMLRGPTDGFIFKLDPTGSTLLYSTFLGGTNWEMLSAIAVATNGEVVVVGQTYSSDFPITPGGIPASAESDSLPSFLSDVVVTRLGASGSNLVYSTCPGGLGHDYGAAIALDGQGNALVTGVTSSEDFPTTTNAFQRTLTPGGSIYASPGDVFIMRLSPQGSILYSTLWGTPDYDTARDIAVDASERIYVVGVVGPGLSSPGAPQARSLSSGGPTPPVTDYPTGDAFVLRVEASGNVIDFANSFGGTGMDGIEAVKVDAAGNVHVAGYFASQRFVGQLASNGAGFVRLMSVHNCQSSGFGGLAIGPDASVYVAGNVYDPSLASVPDLQRSKDIFVKRLAPVLSSPANHAPFASLTLLSHGTQFGSNEVVWLRADAADVPGTVAAVRIEAGGNVLATFTNPPYVFAWTNPPLGTHQLRAIAVDNFGDCSTSCPVNISIAVPPANDSFYRSTHLIGTALTVSGSNIGATAEPGEPGQPYPQGHSVWWCWNPPESGVYRLEITGSSFRPSISVFTGSDLPGLELREPGPAPYPYYVPALAFNAFRPVTYYFLIDSYDVGNFTLSLSPVTPPPNDDNGIALMGAPLSIEGSNVNATDNASVWYAWFAPDPGTYFVSVQSSNFRPSVYVESRGTNPVVLPPPFDTQYQVIRAQYAGEPFDIKAEGNGGMGTFTLTISPVALPANDNFADAAAIFLGTSVTGSTYAASAEVAEPSHAAEPYSSDPMSSVWFTWHAPSNGLYRIRANTSFQQAHLGVYTGTSLSNLTVVGRASRYNPELTFRGSSGTDYRIAVDVDYYTDGFNYELLVTTAVGLPNDDFANRILLSGVPVNASGSIRGATSEVGEPIHFADGTAQPSIWYSWVAPWSGNFTVIATGSSGPVIAVVYSGTNLTNLVRLTGPTWGYPSLSQFAATAGVKYQIALAGYPGGDGVTHLEIRASVPPLNDNFANRAMLEGASISIQATNIGATIESGEPLPISDAAASLWWRWTAPHSGQFLFQFSEQTISAAVEVYVGDTLQGLSAVPSDFYEWNRKLIHAAAGQQYQIAAYGLFGQQGTFTLKISAVDPPPNDNFADAALLSGSLANVQTSALGATVEAGEPFHSNMPSLWWRWTAPASGTTTMRVPGDRWWGPQEIAIYRGETLASLVVVTNSVFSLPTVTFPVEAGTEYYIAVYPDLNMSPFTLFLIGPAPLMPAEFGSVQRLPDGSFQFLLVGWGYKVVEASVNLRDWVPIATNGVDCMTHVMNDPGATNYTRRFYRLRTQ
jgi:hypothetical protein